MYYPVKQLASVAGFMLALKQLADAIKALLSHLDFVLFGALGLASLQTDFQNQLTAAMKAAATISINVVNPFAGIANAIAQIGTLLSSLMAALAQGLPAIQPEISAQLSTTLALAAQLQAQVSAIEAMVKTGVSLKAPILNLIRNLDLSAGPLDVIAWESIPMAAGADNLLGHLSADLGSGIVGIRPDDKVSGFIVLTRSNAAWSALKAALAV